MEKEIRQLNTSDMQVNDRSVDGYAAVFNSPSEDLGGFIEVIADGAFDGVIDRSDVYALLNHDPEKVLARSKYGVGSLGLTVDSKGLRYVFDAPKTDLGDTVLEFIRRGEIDSSSFAFVVGEDRWEKQADGMYLRTILSFKSLHDISPVFDPAYAATSVKCARFAEIQEEERIENEKRMAEAEKERETALTEYYNKLKEEIEKI